MSGIDECKFIPECPRCTSRTNFWAVRDKSNSSHTIAFLNFSRRFAEVNGEFNFFESTKEDILRRAGCIKCSDCDYTDDGALFQIAMYAFRNETRRYPELVRHR